MTKKCTKCKKIQELTEFSKQSNIKSGFRSNCKTCASIDYKIWSKKNKIVKYQNYVSWTINNREKYLVGKKRYYAKNRTSIRKRVNEKNSSNSASLTDTYVKYQLTRRTDLRSSDMSDEIIKAKRLQIKLMRAIKDD